MEGSGPSASRARGGFVLSFALLAACGADKAASGDATSAATLSDVTGETTVTISDANGETLDAGGETSGPTSFCATADDCAESGALCACDGSCVVPTGKACTEDRNCGVPNWCNPCTGHCEPQAALCEPCAGEHGCVDQGACLPFASGGNFCGLACVTDVACPAGYHCRTIAHIDLKQCTPDSGRCDALGLCQTDGDCPVGEICQDVKKTCGPGCTEDGQCPDAKVCASARCVPPCGGNGDCTAPAECDAGHCKIPGACEKAADCPAPATYCSRETGQCAPGCLEDADCKDAAKVCADKACVDKGCLHHFECAFGKVCDHASGACVPYPADMPYCASCDAAAETNPSCPEPNLCVQYQDADGKALGDFCLVPCADDPIDRCPSGWGCKKLENPETGDARYMCERPYYLNPVTTP